MPTYVYRCECGKEWENFHTIQDRNTERCVCGKHPEIVPCAQISVFKPFFNEHLEPDRSIYIRSKGHYKEELKKRGFTCPNL